MFCWRCGQELPDGQRFCGHCGAEQSAASRQASQDPSAGYEPPKAPEPPTPDHDRPEGPSGWSAAPGPAAPRGDLSILFKCFGILCAILYGIATVSVLFDMISDVFWLVTNVVEFVDIPFAILVLVREVVMVVLGVVVCLSALLIALRRRPDNADGLFLVFAGGVLLRSLVRILFVPLFLLVSGVYSFRGGIGGCLSSLVLGVIAIGALAGITVLNGEPVPLMGRTPEEIRASLSAALTSARQAADSAAQKAQDARAARAQGAGTYGYAGSYGRLKTDRSLLIYILLSVITCGIYGLYFIYKLAQDVNTVCDGDGEHTSGLLVFFLLTLVTCGIYGIWWYYAVANRLAANAPRYGLHFQENGTTVLLWELVGLLICGIGPFIALHIILKNTNSLCMAYNQYNGL